MFKLTKDGEVLHAANTRGGISDGNHTFDELYDHRCLLFLMVMDAHPEESWFSKKHDDGEEWDGWFICGTHLPTGMVTYHLPDRMWNLAVKTGANELDKGPEWDGHTSKDVIKRLTEYLEIDH